MLNFIPIYTISDICSVGIKTFHLVLHLRCYKFKTKTLFRLFACLDSEGSQANQILNCMILYVYN